MSNVDLSEAVIIVPQGNGPLLKYAVLLSSEVQRRCPKARWSITQADGDASIVIGKATANVILLSSPSKSQATVDYRREYSMILSEQAKNQSKTTSSKCQDEVEGYNIVTVPNRRWLHIKIAASSNSMVLSAIYRFLRELRVHSDFVRCMLGAGKKVVSVKPSPFSGSEGFSRGSLRRLRTENAFPDSKTVALFRPMAM